MPLHAHSWLTAAIVTIATSANPGSATGTNVFQLEPTLESLSASALNVLTVLQQPNVVPTLSATGLAAARLAVFSELALPWRSASRSRLLLIRLFHLLQTHPFQQFRSFQNALRVEREFSA